MRFLRFVSLSALTALIACTSTPPEELVATVNGNGVTRTAYDASLKQTMERYAGSGAKLPAGLHARLKEIVLRRLVDEAVITQAAETNKVTVEAADIDKRFGEHRSRFASDDAFKRFLERSKNTEEGMKSEMRRGLLRDKVVEKLAGPVVIDPAVVEKHYKDNPGRFQQRERRDISRIVLRVAKDADAKARAEAKKKAQIVAKKVKGGADFAAAAKATSEGPAAKNGGNIGWFHRGQFPANYDKAVFSAGVNQITDVMETRLGYEIVRINRVEESRQKTLAEVTDAITRSLTARAQAEKRRTVIRDLKAKAKVEYLLTFKKPDAALTKKVAPVEKKAEAAAAPKAE